MAHPMKHAESSARKFGGKAQDYLAIHRWFDESKAFLSDFRHRALRHHAEGIFLCEMVFGMTITNSEGKPVPVRYVGEQHVKEDLGRIPTAQDWLMQIKPQRWMYGQRLDKKETVLGQDSKADQESSRPPQNKPQKCIVSRLSSDGRTQCSDKNQTNFGLARGWESATGFFLGVLARTTRPHTIRRQNAKRR